jgi:hypothetical protein
LFNYVFTVRSLNKSTGVLGNQSSSCFPPYITSTDDPKSEFSFFSPLLHLPHASFLYLICISSKSTSRPYTFLTFIRLALISPRIWANNIYLSSTDDIGRPSWPRIEIVLPTSPNLNLNSHEAITLSAPINEIHFGN